LPRRGEGLPPHSPEKAAATGPDEVESGPQASAVSLIGQRAPLIVIALMLETAREWCLADETRRAEKP
jgi:hypothetical protein